MSDKLVTAVITTYKRDVKTVERALKSIVKQEYSNIEVIIVNDYPDDVDLVKSLSMMIDSYRTLRKIEYIVLNKNEGACKARNAALKKARGEYIAFLDDDDEWLLNKIALQVACLEKNKDSVIVYCNSFLDFEKEKTRRIMYNQKKPEGLIFGELLSENIVGSCTYPMFRTSELRKVGGFGEYMPALQDWELYLRLLKNGKACYLDKPLAVYYFYEGERISAHPERRTHAFEIIEREFRTEINAKGNEEYKSSFWLKGTYFYVMNNEIQKAFSAYIVAITSDPRKIGRNIVELLKLFKRIFIKPSVY